MGEAWGEYVAAARELDAVRWEEQARTAGLQAGVAEMSGHAERLEGELRDQGVRLTQLARQLRFKTPKLGADRPEGEPEPPANVLTEVARKAHEADRLAQEAYDRGKYPAFLPRWGTGARNVLIYGVVALVVLAAQATYYERSDGEPNGPLLLFVLPLIGYLVGLALAGIAARQRIQEGTKPSASPRLGLVLVFGIAPVAFAGFVLHSFLSR